jgi:hypothetical protein
VLAAARSVLAKVADAGVSQANHLGRLRYRLTSERGQGTVEYVGLILLVSLLMVGMVAAMKGFNGSLT